MTPSLWTVASGAVAALGRLDAAAQNLANVNTTGYKAERPVFRLRSDVGAPTDPADPVARHLGGPVVEIERRRDFGQGSIHETGDPLDVAIEGDGFFVVNTPNGERYTRAGQFEVDDEGFLATPDGHRVQGDGDLRIGNGTPAIAADGSITVDGAPVGTLKIVSFGDKPALVPEGAGLYAPASRSVVPTPLDARDVTVTQGALEAANVDAVSGLVELVDVSRGYEQYMKAIERMDQLTQRSINEVGRVG